MVVGGEGGEGGGVVSNITSYNCRVYDDGLWQHIYISYVEEYLDI